MDGVCHDLNTNTTVQSPQQAPQVSLPVCLGKLLLLLLLNWGLTLPHIQHSIRLIQAHWSMHNSAFSLPWERPALKRVQGRNNAKLLHHARWEAGLFQHDVWTCAVGGGARGTS